MRRARFIALCIAGICAMLAVLNAKQWVVESLRQEAELLRERAMRIAARPKPTVGIETTAVVVAARDLAFGAELTSKMLREIQWPADAVPAGAFRTVAEVIANEDKRYMLAAIRKDEVILPGKVTGLGERPGLSALLQPDTTAVTIRVNEVEGVAGFVLPGDRVDVLLTREAVNSVDDKDDVPASNAVLLQNVRVLAVDQLSDAADRKPVAARTVTVEVPLKDAQRLALSAKVGELSLALRQSGGAGEDARGSRITIADLVVDKAPAEQPPVEASVVNLSANLQVPVVSSGVTVTILRGTKEAVKSEEYQVVRR